MAKNAKQYVNALRSDVSTDLLCSESITRVYMLEILLWSVYQTDNLDGMPVVAPQVNLAIIVFI